MSELDANWLIRSHLKTRQLALLLALDEVRNINGAASLLNMSQPAASKMLKELEDGLGIALFERLPRGIRPTTYGESMIRHTRMAVTSLAQAHEDIAALKSGLTGQVNVGVIMGPGMALMAPAIAATIAHSPLLRIGVEQSNSAALLKRLKRGDFDFLLARVSEQIDNSDLRYEELSDELICVIVRAGHPLQHRAQLSLAELATQHWILPQQGSILRHRFDLMLRRSGLESPRTIVETTETMVAMSLLRQTDFLHLVPRDVAGRFMDFGKLAILPVDLPCKMDGFGIITRRHQLLSPGAKIFLSAVQEVAQKTYAGYQIQGN